MELPHTYVLIRLGTFHTQFRELGRGQREVLHGVRSQQYGKHMHRRVRKLGQHTPGDHRDDLRSGGHRDDLRSDGHHGVRDGDHRGGQRSDGRPSDELVLLLLVDCKHHGEKRSQLGQHGALQRIRVEWYEQIHNAQLVQSKCELAQYMSVGAHRRLVRDDDHRDDEDLLLGRYRQFRSHGVQSRVRVVQPHEFYSVLCRERLSHVEL